MLHIIEVNQATLDSFPVMSGKVTAGGTMLTVFHFAASDVLF